MFGKRKRTTKEHVSLLGVILAVPALVGTLDLVFNRGTEPVAPQEVEVKAPAGPTGYAGLPHYIEDPKAASDHVSELARRTRGDFTQLSEIEQRWINAMTASYGHELLWSRCRILGIEPEGPPPPARGYQAPAESLRASASDQAAERPESD